jgi:hypothetical protein
MTNSSRNTEELLSFIRMNNYDEVCSRLAKLKTECSDKAIIGLVVGLGQVEYIGVSTYTIVMQMIKINDDTFWHKCARDLLSTSLCHLPGALRSSFWHSQKVLQFAITAEDVEKHIDLGRNQGDFMPDNDLKYWTNQLALLKR